MDQTKLFENKKVRSVGNAQETRWYFSVADVVQILTDSVDIKQYVKKLRQRDPELARNWGTICTPLELIASEGKKRSTLCSHTEGLLRIIQSIPSPKAEPFKRSLAKVGSERLDEIQNPELADKRMEKTWGERSDRVLYFDCGNQSRHVRHDAF